MQFFQYNTAPIVKAVSDNSAYNNRPALREAKDDGVFKAYIPNFLYKPPYGMPRKVNLQAFKTLAKNPYVFSIIKTLCDEATSVGWEIKVKEEFNESNNDKKEEDDKEGPEEKAEPINYDNKIKEVTKFFNNPNGNEQSLGHITRQLITDISEIDAGVLVKVFNRKGEFKQMFARDGATFLKNPDIYGYMGDKADFVPPLPDGFTGVGISVGGSPSESQQQLMKQYDILYRQQAAYFQYGWTAGSMPVPFGKREIVYIMQNPRGDSIYGRSPIEILTEIILNLIYGADFNLDFYTNNNMPEGVIQLLGAQQSQITNFRQNFEQQFKYTDDLGRRRKKFFTYPITTTEVKFTPFQLNPKEMEVITQQQWFTKLLWMCFGVTAEEMGFTENSNKAVSQEQTKLAKRKAIKPLLDVLAYHFNTQIMPEFFANGKEIPDSGDVPIEFVYDEYDLDEDNKKHDLFAKQINMGIKTPEMVAKELGIDIEELVKQKEEQREIEQETFNNQNPQEESGFSDNEEPKDKKKENPFKKKEKPEEKATDKPKELIDELDNFIDDIGNALVDVVSKIPDQEV